METTTNKTISLAQQDFSCIWHPFTQMQNGKPPIAIKRAEGAYLYTEEGRKILDAISSWWVNIHGHGHPYIAKKIQEQAAILEHVIFADFTHQPAVDLALGLLEILPYGMSKIFYSDNGSTAVEIALKIALQYWYNQNPATKRKKIVSFKGSFHGETFGSMSAAGKNPLHQPFWNHLFEVALIDPPIKGKEDLSLTQLNALLSKEEIAAFIFEPLILGVGGMIIYPAKGLDHLLSLCRKYDVLTIADEALTGFGRTGKLFASDNLTETPDIICLAKGLSGGFLPLGATACKQFLYDAFLGDDLKRALLHGHSYTGNPIACASALASLELLKESSCTRQRKMIAAKHARFCEIWRSHPKLKRTESLGVILALEYENHSGTNYFAPLRDRLYDFFLKKDILLRPLGNVIYVIPPYCIQENELQSIYDAIIATLEGEI